MIRHYFVLSVFCRHRDDCNFSIYVIVIMWLNTLNKIYLFSYLSFIVDVAFYTVRVILFPFL